MEQKWDKQILQLCAELLYKNFEQEAYEAIKKILPSINDMLQTFARIALEQPGGEENAKYVLQVMQEFLNAYQRRDNLALADLMYYNLIEIADVMTEQEIS